MAESAVPLGLHPSRSWVLWRVTAAAVLLLGVMFVVAPLKAAAQPPNDNIASAMPLSGKPDRDGDIHDGDLGETVGAGKEAGEPNHAGNAGGGSLWYTWTPTRGGRVEIETCDEDTTFDTLLAVYTASGSVPPFTNLAPVASNDNSTGEECYTGQSSVRFNATAGTTYYIALDGAAGETGDFWLFLWAPAPSPETYAGRTSQGKRIRFELSPDGTRITGLSVGVRAQCRIRGRSRKISATLRQESGDTIRVRRGRFAETFRPDVPRGFRESVRIVGRLRGNTFRGTVRDRVSGPGIRCDTGSVSWSAR